VVALSVRLLIYGAVLPALLVALGASAQDTRGPQAAPLLAVLEAAKTGDLSTFKNAYSSRIRDDAAQGDWSKNLAEAHSNLTRMFGDYRLADFGFAFAGDSERGRVALSYKGQPQFDLAVIREDGGWKLDER